MRRWERLLTVISREGGVAPDQTEPACRWWCCLSRCQEDTALEEECRKNKEELMAQIDHENLICFNCREQFLSLPEAESSVYVCRYGRTSCPAMRTTPPNGLSRFSCFLCDSHICDECAKISEEKKQSSEKETEVEDTNIETSSEVIRDDDEASLLIDENENTKEAFRVLDDIPLIDELPSAEPDNVSVKTEKMKLSRPSFLRSSITPGFYCNPLSVDSPDIFSLRAPLVSCENILTPGISAELLIPKQI